MDWRNSRNQPEDELHLDAFLPQHLLDLQGSTAASYAAPAQSVLPSWSFTHNQDETYFDPTTIALDDQTQQSFAGQPQALYETGAAADSRHQQPADTLQPSSSSGSGRGKGKDSSSGSGKRSEAWTLKNRRAQKKFREKQKVTKSQMQQQLADMTTQLQDLQMEHDKLTGRSAVLDKVLHSRQSQLTILQEQQKTMQKLSGGIVDDQTNQLALSQQQQSSQPGKTSLPVAWPAIQAQPSEVNAVYAAMVSRVKSVVDRLDRGGTGAQLDAELEKACLTLGFFIKETILGNADNLRKLYMVNIDPEDWDTSDLLYRMPEHWQAVTNSLQLTDDQKTEMVRLRSVSFAKQAANQAHWHQICSAIAQCTTHDVADKDVQPELAKDSQRLQDLKANLRKGQDIWLELYQQIFVKVWTRMQYARAVIASGPHHIDALAIATCVAQQQASSAAAEVPLQ